MPTAASDDALAESLARDASLAPSMHNAQPWLFRYHRAEHTFELRADTGRAMPSSDPWRRALHIGCGAALLNLRVAAQHAGFRSEVHLLPRTGDAETLAFVHLAAATSSLDHDLYGLYSSLGERHTSRYPFAEKPVPTALQNRLVDQARAEGARLTFLTGWHLDLALDVIDDTERGTADSGDPDEERWTRKGAALSDTAKDGVPEYSFGPRKRAGRAPIRDFAHGHAEADRGTTDFEQLPNLALLYTDQDKPEDWLTAGQALERVLLTATHEGLASSFDTRALERSELRWLMRDPLRGPGPVQMLLRLGYGPLGLRTPRRPVGDILEIVP